MKLSFVLTFGMLVATLWAAPGCAKRLATPHQHAVRTPASAPSETVSVPVSKPEPEMIEPAPLPATNQISNVVVVQEPPPLPQVEMIGNPPNPNYTWVPGHWSWDGSWTWVSGNWEALPQPNASWIPGRWTRRGDGWVWMPGHWKTAALK